MKKLRQIKRIASVAILIIIAITAVDKLGLLEKLNLPGGITLPTQVREVADLMTETAAETVANVIEEVKPKEVAVPTPRPDLPDAMKNQVLISFIDVGQGDSTLIVDAGQNMLIDTGYYDGYDNVVTTLEENNVQRIDYLVLTHPDADHIQNAPALIEQYDVQCVYMPNLSVEKSVYQDVVSAIVSHGVRVVNPTPGEYIPFGNATYEVLGPIRIDNEDTNADSIVIKMVNGYDSFLFCGDATGPETEDIMASGFDVSAQVYKAAHHGSANDGCNSDRFLDAVDPEIVIVSCGLDNPYGHPHREVMKYLKKNVISLFRTDVQGTINCVSSGDGISFNKEVSSVYTNGEDL